MQMPPRRPDSVPALLEPAVDAAAAAEPGPRVLNSEVLLRGQRAVEILHADVRYRLSVTAMGKLILTK